jgi:hypothetical protein
MFKSISGEFNFRFIALASGTSLLLLGLLSLSGFLFYRSLPAIKDCYATYNVSGKVLEYGSEASISDFRLKSGDMQLFSIYDGSYFWEDLDEGTRIVFDLPEGFETNASEPIKYSDYKELGLLRRSVDHSFYLVLGVEKTAVRIFDYLKLGSHHNIWKYLTNESMLVWSDKKHDFTKALDTERGLRSKIDKSQLAGYEILGLEETVEDEMLFTVFWERGNGSKFVSQERFVRNDGWWHYMWQRNPKEIYSYIYNAEKLLGVKE